MSHKQHDAACSGQRVEWSRYGQYQSEIGNGAGTYCSSQPENIVIRVQGSVKSYFHTRANAGKFSATRARWFIWYTNSMMQLVLARDLRCQNLGNTTLKWASCEHVLFRST